VFGEILNLLTGITATIVYLYAWRRLTATRTDDETNAASSRMRARLWQIAFLLGLTPYVLFVFYLMDFIYLPAE
jgi:nicotinamide riboside transporter PnuC